MKMNLKSILHGSNEWIDENGNILNHVLGDAGRESITVLACISTDIPLFIVFKGAAVQAHWNSMKSYLVTTYGVH